MNTVPSPAAINAKLEEDNRRSSIQAVLAYLPNPKSKAEKRQATPDRKVKQSA